MSGNQTNIGIGDKRDIQEWMSGVTYQLYEEVSNAGTVYISLVCHVSVDFATDDAAGKWQIVGGAASPPPSSSLLGLTDTAGVAIANAILRWDGSGTTVNYVLASAIGLSEFNNDVPFLDAEGVDDRVAALIQNGTGLSWTYNDVANTLTGDVGGLTVSEFASANISQWTNDAGYLTTGDGDGIYDGSGTLSATTVVTIPALTTLDLGSAGNLALRATSTGTAEIGNGTVTVSPTATTNQVLIDSDNLNTSGVGLNVRNLQTDVGVDTISALITNTGANGRNTALQLSATGGTNGNRALEVLNGGVLGLNGANTSLLFGGATAALGLICSQTVNGNLYTASFDAYVSRDDGNDVYGYRARSSTTAAGSQNLYGYYAAMTSVDAANIYGVWSEVSAPNNGSLAFGVRGTAKTQSGGAHTGKLHGGDFVAQTFGASATAVEVAGSCSAGVTTASTQTATGLYGAILMADNTVGATVTNLIALDVRIAGTGTNTYAIITADHNSGFGVSSPAEKVDVNGAIKVGSAAGTNDGTIQWTGSDFEGRKAGAWVSLTDGANIGTVNTTDATVTTVDTIDTLTDNSSHLIEVTVTTEQDTNGEGGAWKKRLWVTKRSGTVVIQNTSNVYNRDDAGGGLNANSVTFAVSAGNVNIQVKGQAATNYKWDSTYKIVQLTTN